MRYPSRVVAVIDRDVRSEDGSETVLGRGATLYGCSLPFLGAGSGSGAAPGTNGVWSTFTAKGARVQFEWQSVRRPDGTGLRITERVSTSYVEGRAGVPGTIAPDELERYERVVNAERLRVAAMLSRLGRAEATASQLAIDELIEMVVRMNEALAESAKVINWVTLASGQKLLLRPAGGAWLSPAEGDDLDHLIACAP